MRTAEIVVSETRTYVDTSYAGCIVGIAGDAENVSDVLAKLGLVSVDPRPTTRVVERLSLTTFLTRVAKLISLGSTIQAIKEVRELTGLDLKSAKDLIDMMSGRLRV